MPCIIYKIISKKFWRLFELFQRKSFFVSTAKPLIFFMSRYSRVSKSLHKPVLKTFIVDWKRVLIVWFSKWRNRCSRRIRKSGIGVHRFFLTLLHQDLKCGNGNQGNSRSHSFVLTFLWTLKTSKKKREFSHSHSCTKWNGNDTVNRPQKFCLSFSHFWFKDSTVPKTN